MPFDPDSLQQLDRDERPEWFCDSCGKPLESFSYAMVEAYDAGRDSGMIEGKLAGYSDAAAEIRALRAELDALKSERV